MYSLASLAIFAFAVVTSTTAWTLSDNYVGSGFLSGFSHQSISDPTHGRVYVYIRLHINSRAHELRFRVYVDQGTALANNLTYANGDTFIIRVDYKTKLSSGGAGRKSVRLLSNKSYRTHVIVYVASIIAS
jgi:hypothetical protein